MNGKKTYHHARFPPETIAKGIRFVDEFQPSTLKERRDKIILEKFFVQGLTYTAIADLRDNRITGIGNRAKGKHLSGPSIARIVTSYFPELKNVPAKENRADYVARNELKCKRRQSPSKHVRSCAFCGSKDNLEEHHMIPLVMGGTNDERNLIFLCAECHKQVTSYQMQIVRQ